MRIEARRWQDDARFRCPSCGELIQIKFTDRLLPGTGEHVVGCCIPCQQLYPIEVWRELHGSYRPRTDTLPVSIPRDRRDDAAA